jgi:hypothetical protein
MGVATRPLAVAMRSVSDETKQRSFDSSRRRGSVANGSVASGSVANGGRRPPQAAVHVFSVYERDA